MKKTQALFLTSLTFLFSAITAPAESVTLTDNFESGAEKWDKPSSSALKIGNGEMLNKTKYAVNVAFKEKEIDAFELSFKLKLLIKTTDEGGHFAISIDRGEGKWALYLTTAKSSDSVKIISMYYKNGEKKPLDRKSFKTDLSKDKELDIKIICGKDDYKLQIGEKSFQLGKAPGKGGFTLGSYRQPFIVKDLKIVYDKP